MIQDQSDARCAVIAGLAAGSYEDFLQALVEDPSLWEWVRAGLSEILLDWDDAPFYGYDG